MALQIWLLNPYKMHYRWTDLCEQVKELMKPVIKDYDSNSKNKVKFGSVTVSNRYTVPPIASQDLAVYVVPVPFYGFVGTDFGSSGHRHDAGGLTSPFQGQTCSEVYAGGEEVAGTVGDTLRVDALNTETKTILVDKKYSTKLLAKVIFHELMHYVTPKWPEGKLHNYKGVSLGKSQVNENMPQSEADIEILSDHLTSHGQRPWTGAWDAMRQRGFSV